MSAPAPILLETPPSIRNAHRAPSPRPAQHSQRAKRRTIKSHLIGDFVVRADAVLEFPDGLFGFPGCKEWVLVSAERPGWCWLHAADHPSLAFLMVDPFTVFPDFAVDLTAQDLAVLGAKSASEVAVFTIVTLPRDAGALPTANLQGPVAIALPTKRGRQLVLNDTRFSARTPLAQVLGPVDDTQA